MVKVKIIQNGLQHKVGEVIEVSDNHATEMVELKQAEIFQKIIQMNDKRTIIKQFLKIQPIFYDRGKNWWVWNFENYKWKLIDETDIINALNDTTKQNTINSNERIELLEVLKQEGRRTEPKPISPYWLQFHNRLIDLMENQIIYPTPEFFVTNPIPYDLGISEETPVMDKIFEEWVGKDNVQLLYEIIAYCCLPSYPINRLFCFVGSGMNGKSKFLELIKKFVGNDNITTTELDVLLQSRFEVTRLHKKLVCLMGETNFNELKNTSILKKLTGGDLIGFEYKNKNPFEDINYAKIIIATNNLPTTTDKTLGFYRRWLIVDFPNQFTEKRDILFDIPTIEYNNLALKCVRIIRNLLLNREFTNEGNVEERMKRFEDRSNPLDKFLKEMTEDEPNGDIPCWEFIKELNTWLKINRFREMNEHFIGTKMKQNNYPVQRISKQIYDKDQKEFMTKQVKCYTYLRWKSSDSTNSTDTSIRSLYKVVDESGSTIRTIGYPMVTEEFVK
jgi:P4 family phage/plasmid primase-like protien